jgi:hypothetical protein
MENTGMNFERRPGGRRGCSCCGLWMMGLMALPVLATLLLIVAL